MKSFIRSNLLLFALIFVSPCIHAHKNTAVFQWAAETLIKTLSINYNYQPSDFTEIKKHYSYNAWEGVVSFFSGRMENIRLNRLTLHPKIEGEPILLSSGTSSGIHYWIIHQKVSIVELSIIITFKLTILARGSSSSHPYMIHSLHINITHY